MAMIKIDFLRILKFLFGRNFAFGVIIYNKNFPPGGDVYNLFRKTGLSFGYIFSIEKTMEISFKKLHVSNRQWIGAQNPSYEGLGISLEIINKF